MGCSSSAADESTKAKPKSSGPAKLEVSEEIKSSGGGSAQARPEKIKGSLGNRRVREYNESALKINKYWRDQQPPQDQETQYVDDLFPPNNNSVFAKDEDGNLLDGFTERTNGYGDDFNVVDDEIEWYTAEEIFPGKHCIFEDKIEFDDIKQGSVGNCYFMSAISAMCEFPEFIVEIFRTLKVTPNGCYEVVLRLQGEWQVVLLDNYFPCKKNGKRPVFSKLWCRNLGYALREGMG